MSAYYYLRLYCNFNLRDVFHLDYGCREESPDDEAEISVPQQETSSNFVTKSEGAREALRVLEEIGIKP